MEDISLAQRILTVELLPPTEEGRVYYSEDPTLPPRVWFARTNMEYEKKYGINIEGGYVLLGIDPNRILRTVEFVYHQRGWRKYDIAASIPQRAMDIRFPNVEIRHAEMDIDVIAYTDSDYRFVQFRFYDMVSTGEWIALSDRFFALIIDNHLCGFLIRLKQ